MAFTREQAIAEQQRRQAQPAPTQTEPTQVAAQPTFTREQAMAELQRRQTTGGDLGISRDSGDITDSGVRTPTQDGLEERASFAGAGIVEPAATLASSIIAEPIAGLAGLAKAAFAPSPEEAVRRGTEAVSSTREALTFQPKTEEGQKSLQSLGKALAPIGETLQSAEKFLGDETFEATGSPALAALATTIPTAVIEALGLASGKAFIKGARKSKALSKNKEIRKAIVDSAPDIDQIKDTSRAVYKELDDAGVVLKPDSFKNLNNNINVAVTKAGFRKNLAPKTAAVLEELKGELGRPQTLTKIDELRRVAQGAASTLDPNDARLGAIIIDNIDTFLDTAKPEAFSRGAARAVDVTPKFRVARELWGRARRSEMINEAFEKAKNQASGFENGIVTQFRGILNNKKKSRFFKPKEIEAMQTVVRGTTAGNMAKLVGRLGFSEGHATNILGGAVGAGAGAALFGTPGAIAVPVIGQVSKKLAQRLTRKGAEFANTVIRAGDNADDIARAYLKNTPKAQRSTVELSELLARPDIALDDLLTTGNKFVREAVETARGRQVLQAVAASGAGLGATKEVGQQ